jgi:hypothetical protein
MRSTRFLVPTADRLSSLAQLRSGEVISVLLPPRPSPEARITLRNLLRSLERRLTPTMRAADIKGWLAPFSGIRDDHEVWNEPVISAAFYLDGSELTITAGPTLGEPLLVLAPRFHITHLLGAVPALRYAVLVLSRGCSHLYRGRGDSFSETKTAGLPAEMAEVLRYDDREPQLQSHGSSRRGAGRVVAAFHGQGGRGDQVEDLHRYLRFVAAEVEEVLGGEPLVLAATDELAAAYRRTTTYGNVAPATIPGSAERLTESQLATAASAVVASTAEERRLSSIDEFFSGDRAGSIVYEPGEILTAAHDGRVQGLVVAADRQLWGAYDAQLRRISELSDAGREVDLLNEAAAETWLHGGEVITAETTEVPGPWPVAAMMRF